MCVPEVAHSLQCYVCTVNTTENTHLPHTRLNLIKLANEIELVPLLDQKLGGSGVRCVRDEICNILTVKWHCRCDDYNYTKAIIIYIYRYSFIIVFEETVTVHHRKALGVAAGRLPQLQHQGKIAALAVADNSACYKGAECRAAILGATGRVKRELYSLEARRNDPPYRDSCTSRGDQISSIFFAGEFCYDSVAYRKCVCTNFAIHAAKYTLLLFTNIYALTVTGSFADGSVSRHTQVRLPRARCEQAAVIIFHRRALYCTSTINTAYRRFRGLPHAGRGGPNLAT